MTARDFLDQVVTPTVDEFYNNYGDLRHAFLAVAVVDMLAAQIFHDLEVKDNQTVQNISDDSDYRGNLSQTNKDFCLLRDVAKAHKHVKLNRGTPLVDGSDQTSVKSLGWGVARWGEGRWGSPPQVVVATNSGEYRVVETIIKKSLEFLKAEMNRHGI